MSYDEDLDPDDPTSEAIRKQATGELYVSRSTIERRAREIPPAKDYEPKETALDFQPHEQPKSTPSPKIIADVERGILGVEKQLGRFSQGLRTRSEELRGLDYPDAIRRSGEESAPGEVTITKKARVRIDPSFGGKSYDEEAIPTTFKEVVVAPEVARAEGLMLRFGAGLYDALTMPARPLLIGETVATGTGVILSNRIRREVLEVVKKDPAGFGAELAGSLSGGYILGKGIRGAKTRIERFRYGRTVAEIPIEDFYVKEDLMGQYPEVVDYTKTEVGLKKVTETKTLANEKFGKFTDSALKKFGDIDDASAIYIKPSGTKTPLSKTFRKEVEGYVPSGGRATAELVPLLDKPIKIDYEVPYFQKITRYGHRPGVSFRGISPTITKPFPYGPTLFGGATALRLREGVTPTLDQAISPKIVQESRVIQFEGHTQIQKPKIDPEYKPRPPKPIIITSFPPIYKPKPIPPIQHQRQGPRQTPIISPILETRPTIAPPFTPPPFGLTQPGKKKQKLLMPPLKKMNGFDYRKGLFAGEFRGYKLQDPRKILELA